MTTSILLNPESGQVRVSIGANDDGTITVDAGPHWNLPLLPIREARELARLIREYASVAENAAIGPGSPVRLSDPPDGYDALRGAPGTVLHVDGDGTMSVEVWPSGAEEPVLVIAVDRDTLEPREPGKRR